MGRDFIYLTWSACICTWKANDTETCYKESQDGGNSRRNVDCVVTGGDLNARAGHSCVELGTCGHTEKAAEVLRWKATKVGPGNQTGCIILRVGNLAD
jgi:hypothetical protein